MTSFRIAAVLAMVVLSFGYSAYAQYVKEDTEEPGNTLETAASIQVKDKEKGKIKDSGATDINNGTLPPKVTKGGKIPVIIDKPPVVSPTIQGVKPELIPGRRPVLPKNTPTIPNVPRERPSPVENSPASEALARAADFLRERIVVCIPGGKIEVHFRDRQTSGLSTDDGRIVESFGAEIDVTRRSADGLAPGKCAFYSGFPYWMREDYRYLDGVYYKANPRAVGFGVNHNVLPELTVNPPGRGGLMIDDGYIRPGILTIGIINAFGNPQRNSPVYLKVKPAKCNEITDCQNTEGQYGAAKHVFFVTKISDTPFTD